jgi:glycosyltransferase involved in cell wall biosynthesis
VSRNRRSSHAIHLLEVGLEWPPETFLRWKLEGLAARGFRVTVATTSVKRRRREGGVALVPQAPWEEARWRTLAGIARSALPLLLRAPARLWRVVRAARRPLIPWPASRWIFLERLRTFLALARLRPDVVHFEWSSAALAFLPMREVWRCPIATSCHGSDVHVHPRTRERAAKGLPLVFREADAVQCVSAALRSEALGYGLEPARARLIRPVVDASFFTPPARRSPEAGFRVVSVGALRWLKGHDYALLAIRRLVDDGIDVRLDVIGAEPSPHSGEPSDRERLLFTVEDLDLGAHVCLHGQQPPEEVRRRLHEADVLLHASLSEGIPTSILEAMACGLPVVATDAGGTSEAVRDGVEGLIVPRRDPARLAAALRTLHADPELRARMGAAGRARATSEFALDGQLDSFVRLYRELTAAGAETRPRVAASEARAFVTAATPQEASPPTDG